MGEKGFWDPNVFNSHRTCQVNGQIHSSLNFVLCYIYFKDYKYAPFALKKYNNLGEAFSHRHTLGKLASDPLQQAQSKTHP